MPIYLYRNVYLYRTAPFVRLGPLLPIIDIYLSIHLSIHISIYLYINCISIEQLFLFAWVHYLLYT